MKFFTCQDIIPIRKLGKSLEVAVCSNIIFLGDEEHLTSALAAIRRIPTWLALTYLKRFDHLNTVLYQRKLSPNNNLVRNNFKKLIIEVNS